VKEINDYFFEKRKFGPSSLTFHDSYIDTFLVLTLNIISVCCLFPLYSYGTGAFLLFNTGTDVRKWTCIVY